MSKITYKDHASNRSGKLEKVYLDGKLVGYILKDVIGYFYEPLGATARGPSYPSIRTVHRALEEK